MLYELKVYDWGARKLIQSNENLQPKGRYVIENPYGQFLAQVIKKVEEKGGAKIDDGFNLAISDDNNDMAECAGCTSCDASHLDLDMRVVRPVNAHDEDFLQRAEKEKKAVFDFCHEKIKELALPMKLVGVDLSFDNTGIVVAFISESRVDFRQLFRDISFHFKKAVRLEQIGSRDEARVCGGYGPCGRELCCARFSDDLKSININMARMQQISHRGSERISGPCGRLFCCLSFELKNYENLLKNLPEIGAEVKAGKRQGFVKNLKVLENKVLVVFQEGEEREEKWFPVTELKFKKTASSLGAEKLDRHLDRENLPETK